MFAALDRLKSKMCAESCETVAARRLQRRAEPESMILKMGKEIQLYRPEHTK